MSRLTITIVSVLCAFTVNAGTVSFSNNSLLIDGVKQPQLFGAEVQYFRMRGGIGPKVPRAKVIALWDKALNQVVAAHMNMISFYIPWDFHEYKKGHFDFDGTYSENGDGVPDYPSRDVKTFIKMAVAKGIKNILIRPGPYINAEWGFLGFGAIPMWFHQEFPDSHMQNAQGLHTTLYDYFDPNFRHYSELWLQAVYSQVIKPYIGPGKPVSFLQLDNETNYQWQSIYNHDYGPRAKNRYREFLKTKYLDLTHLNQAHSRSWTQWSDVQPPVTPGLNLAEDQDWYRFADLTIYQYLQFVRTTWENMGVREPDILFTLAESYNGPENGLIPNYSYRNDQTTGLMTTNMYPKTFELPDQPLHNNPFKTDHDVKAANTANDHYFGRHIEWAMGPEVQAGWWQGINVTAESRLQTYLTTIGHGLKATLLYYFIEGQNWDNQWIYDSVTPFYEQLKKTPAYAGMGAPYPDKFWSDLQSTYEKNVFVGIDVRSVYERGEFRGPELYFDSPLDKAANPRPQFQDLINIGQKIIAPYGDFLGSAKEQTDDVCIVEDEKAHVPSLVSGINSILMNGEWSGGLVGMMEHSGVNPQIIHWGINPAAQLDSCKLIFHQDTGVWGEGLMAHLKVNAQRGATVVNLMGATLLSSWGFETSIVNMNSDEGAKLALASGEKFDVPGHPLYSYKTPANCETTATVQSQTVGFICPVGLGRLIQIGAAPHAMINSSAYNFLGDLPERRAWVDHLLQISGSHPHLRIVEAVPVTAFSRIGEDQRLWITAKNGQSKEENFHLQIMQLIPNKNYEIKNVMTGEVYKNISGKDFQGAGVPLKLGAYESTAYIVSPL